MYEDFIPEGLEDIVTNKSYNKKLSDLMGLDWDMLVEEATDYGLNVKSFNNKKALAEAILEEREASVIDLGTFDLDIKEKDA